MNTHPPSDDDEIVAVRVVFQGRVQGVGFRYQTCRIADQFPISGTVKNLSNGTVELIAQGNQKTVDAFLNSVNRVLQDNITHSDQSLIPVQPTLRHFQILH